MNLRINTNNIIRSNSLKTAILFLESWQKRDYNKMYDLLQITYKSSFPEEKILLNLKQQFSNKLKTFKVIDKERISKYMIDYEVKIEEENKTQTIECVMRLRLIKEIRPYKPNDNGTWGVNPKSCYRTFII